MSDKSDNLFVLKREATREPFRFEVDDVVIEFPHIHDVDQFELAALFADMPDTDLEFITAYFRLVAGEEFAKLQPLGLRRAELEALFEAYKKHVGLNVGESPASSD